MRNLLIITAALAGLVLATPASALTLSGRDIYPGVDGGRAPAAERGVDSPEPQGPECDRPGKSKHDRKGKGKGKHGKSEGKGSKGGKGKGKGKKGF